MCLDFRGSGFGPAAVIRKTVEDRFYLLRNLVAGLPHATGKIGS